MAHLIEKDALVAEIERKIKSLTEEEQRSKRPLFTLYGKIQALKDLSLFINTLEVKEVDLEEKPASNDLEKASEEYAYTNWESDDYHEGASEGKPFDAIGHTQKCFIDGAKWDREQMMKDAIEGKVVAVRNTMSDKLHTYPWIELEAQLSKNDKVKVIIIKE